MYAFAANGGGAPGFPFFQGDGDYSTPAIGNLYPNSPNPFIVDYGDSTAGVAFGNTYTNGAIMRIISINGHLVCQATTDQSGESSPAVGQLMPGGAPMIVAGSGSY